MKLDPELRAMALLRASALAGEAEYHESRARAARSQAALLGRTWGFEVPAGPPLDNLPTKP